MIGEGFHSEELAGHLWKVELNEIGILDIFSFVRWYVDNEIALDSVEDKERLVGWGCKVSLIGLQ